METSSIMELININPVFHIATCEDGKPHFRAVLLFKANEKESVFHTGAQKSPPKQLQKNPKVELCFNDMKKNIQVRIQGKANQKNDPKLIQEIINHPTREFLKPWVEAEGTEAKEELRVTSLLSLWLSVSWSLFGFRLLASWVP